MEEGAGNQREIAYRSTYLHLLLFRNARKIQIHCPSSSPTGWYLCHLPTRSWVSPGSAISAGEWTLLWVVSRHCSTPQAGVAKNARRHQPVWLVLSPQVLMVRKLKLPQQQRLTVQESGEWALALPTAEFAATTVGLDYFWAFFISLLLSDLFVKLIIVKTGGSIPPLWSGSYPVLNQRLQLERKVRRRCSGSWLDYSQHQIIDLVWGFRNQAKWFLPHPPGSERGIFYRIELTQAG